MSLALPENPNLEHLKNQAKDLLRDFEHGDPSAKARFSSIASTRAAAESAAPKLADALHVVAHDYGFASWPKLKQHVESLARILSPGETLSAAIRATDPERVARVLESHPHLKTHLDEPLANYGGGVTPLLAAVQYGNRQIADVLLRAGANINQRSDLWDGGRGVLDECGEDMAAFLIERGAILDAHSAARLGMLAELRDLLAANPHLVNARGAHGQRPLHFASTVDIARLLLDSGADIDALDLLHESTPAQHMLRVLQGRHYRRDRKDISRFLVARGCRTDLLMAAALGDLALVRKHLDADPASIRTCVSEEYFPKLGPRSAGTIYHQIFGPGRTAHIIARDFGHDQIFRLLMDRSPEDLKLSLACELGDEDQFHALLARHPNLVANLSDADRRRLPDAAQNNNTSAVRLMLGAGWPVATRGEYRMSALEWASWHGNLEMVREVLRYHPDVNARENDHDITALGSALHGSENGWHRDTGDYAATVEALLAAGATAPPLTEDLEASEPVREVLARHAILSPGRP